MRGTPGSFLPRVAFDRSWKYGLLPGLAIQWLLYMFPSGRYATILASTRHARSIEWTYIYSVMFYAVLISVMYCSIRW